MRSTKNSPQCVEGRNEGYGFPIWPTRGPSLYRRPFIVQRELAADPSQDAAQTAKQSSPKGHSWNRTAGLKLRSVHDHARLMPINETLRQHPVMLAPSRAETSVRVSSQRREERRARVSFCAVYRGIYEVWSILAPRSPSLANHISAWHIPIRRSLNLVVLQWDLRGQRDNVAKNCRSTCRFSSETRLEPREGPRCSQWIARTQSLKWQEQKNDAIREDARRATGGDLRARDKISSVNWRVKS
jgi:hypothetical protein